MSMSSQKIPISDLRTGMFVGEVYNTRGVLLYTAETLITSENQIEILKKQGVTSVFVHIGNDSGPIDVAVEEVPGRTGADHGACQPLLRRYEHQLRDAYEVHLETVEAVKDTMASVRMGRAFSEKAVLEATESMVNRIIADPDIFISLCQIKDRDQCTYNHSVNVAVLMSALGSSIGLSAERVLELAVGGMLHDIGKMRIPDEVLKKQGRYTRTEFELMKMHPQLGLSVIGNKKRISETSRSIIAQHHERSNGGGYPTGLKGEQIDQFAMMCALADVYDALTTEGAYRTRCLPQEALALIFQGADEDYPRTLVEQFTRLLGIYPVGTFVRLESGEMGIVIRINRQSLLTPTLLILFGESGERLETPYMRDLSTAQQEMQRASWKIESSLDPLRFGVDPARYFSQQQP